VARIAAEDLKKVGAEPMVVPGEATAKAAPAK